MEQKTAKEKTLRFPWQWRGKEIAVLAFLILVSNIWVQNLPTIFCLVTALVSLGGLVSLRGNLYLPGPHFFYDLVRLARRGRSTAVRILFVAALLLGLGYVYGVRFWHRDFLGLLFDSGTGMSINDLSNLAEAYVFSIVIVQNLAVFLLTPAYMAGAVAEERERRTLELLFTSHLHNSEIVIGKLGARLMHLGGVLLASLPVLSLSQLLGGVDMVVLLANFCNTALNLLSVGSVCILVSVLSRSVFAAVLTSYGIVLPFAFCFSCLSMNGMSSFLVLLQQNFSGGTPGAYPHLLETIVGLLFVHGLISCTSLGVAITSLRNSLDTDWVMPRPTIAEVLDISRKPVKHISSLKQEMVIREYLRPLSPIDDRPLLWKEMYLGGQPLHFWPAFWVPLGCFLLPLLMIILVTIFERSYRDMEGFNFLFRLILIFLASLFCLGVAYRTCTSVVREKQQRTLDGLLTLPVSPVEILKAKWLAGLLKGWGWAVFYLPLLLFAVATGLIHILGAFLLVLAPLVHGAFLASLGLYFSVVSRTVLSAQMKVALGLLAIVAMGLITSLAQTVSWGWENFLNVSLNPIATWYHCGFSPNEWAGVPPWADGFPMVTSRIWMALLGLAIYALAAGFFWGLACVSFQSERFRQGE